MPQAAAVMTVSRGIARQYESDLGVVPRVVLSTPAYEDLAPHVPDTPPSEIQLIHHGAATRSRRLERFIELMDHLDDRFELNLMLIESSTGYLRQLKRQAIRNERIRFLPPVPMRDIVRTINRFDVGLAYFEPSTFNLRHVMPNKFFEFIQARLAVAIGPSPEMAEIVSQHGLGLVASEFSPAALAASLNALTGEQLLHFKRNAHNVARRFSADTTRKTLVSIIDEVLRR
jgi:glycosyltransferase involved in cell wall biosynthesis